MNVRWPSESKEEAMVLEVLAQCVSLLEIAQEHSNPVAHIEIIDIVVRKLSTTFAALSYMVPALIEAGEFTFLEEEEEAVRIRTLVQEFVKMRQYFREGEENP